jgi:hypothetical protein
MAWVFGWATAIYLPSLLIASLALSPLAASGNLLVDSFRVADEVSPAAKLAYAILFGGLVLAVRARGGGGRLGSDALLGAISMMLVLALLPEYWSRGFGVGLIGVRFAPLPTIVYVAGGIVSGAVFSVSEARCRMRGLTSPRR